jgi:hypothetical protein
MPSNVGEISRRSHPPQGELLGLISNHDEGHRIGGVCGVRTSTDGIDHHFGITMIGSDEQGPALLAHGFLDSF